MVLLVITVDLQGLLSTMFSTVGCALATPIAVPSWREGRTAVPFADASIGATSVILHAVEICLSR